jgi:hypothetical protein
MSNFLHGNGIDFEAGVPVELLINVEKMRATIFTVQAF